MRVSAAFFQACAPVGGVDQDGSLRSRPGDSRGRADGAPVCPECR